MMTKIESKKKDSLSAVYCNSDYSNVRCVWVNNRKIWIGIKRTTGKHETRFKRSGFELKN